MTTSAQRLFTVDVTPQQRYTFEKVSQLDLKWIRDSYDLDQRSQYNILYEKYLNLLFHMI